MKKRFSMQFITLLMIMIASVTIPSTVAAQSDDQAVVTAILFYSPTCPHCHNVINEVLVPKVK